MAVELSKLLQLVVDKKASELRISVEEPPSVVFRGVLRPLNLPPLTIHDTLRFMKSIAPEGCLREFEDKGSCEFGYPFEKKGHFFVTVFTQGGHCNLKLRLVPKKPRPLGC